MVPVANLKKLFGAEHFTELLMPCEPFEGRYFLADGSLGQIWEIGGHNIDGKTQGQLDAFADRVRGLFLSMYEDVACQIIPCVWKGGEHINKLFSGNPDVTPAVARYLQGKMDMHQEALLRGFFVEGAHVYSPKTIKTYMTCKVINHNVSKKGRVLDRQQWMQELAKIERVENIVESSLTVTQIKCKRLSPDELIGLMFRLLGPSVSTGIAAPRYTGGDMRDYMLKTAPSLDNGDWLCDGHRYKVLSFMKNPAVPVGSNGDTQYCTEANMLFRERQGVSLFNYLDRFHLAIDFHMPNTEKEKASIDNKRRMTWMNRFNFFGDTAIDKELIKKDTDRVVQETLSGNKLMYVSYHLCIPIALDDPEENLKTQQTIAFLDSLGCAAIEETQIGAGIFLRSLPFGYNHHVPGEDRVARSHRVLASNLSEIAPLYCYTKGSQTDIGAIYLNRAGETVLFDPCDPKTSPSASHGIITGETGSGKSVSWCDFIMQSLRQREIVNNEPQDAYFIGIDMGNSYQRACLSNNGQYLKFEGVPMIKLDPFVGSKDDDHKACIVSMLSTMITGGVEQISREEVATLSETVFKVFRDNLESSSSLGDIQSHLQAQDDPIAKSLARKLFPFYGNGQFARFFEGDKPVLDINNHFTVFELGDVDSHKDLQAVIVSQLIHYITEFVKTKPGARKYLFIDEAWSLFRNEVAVQFLVKAVKTFRKLGVSVWFLTQQLDDFKMVAEALNMQDNCPNRILLKQNYDAITRNKEMLGLTDGELEMYRSLQKGPRFSEALIKTPMWTSMVRILLSNRGYWLTTTKDQDRALLEKLMGDMPLQEAIDAAAKQHPFGVH